MQSSSHHKTPLKDITHRSSDPQSDNMQKRMQSTATSISSSCLKERDYDYSSPPPKKHRTEEPEPPQEFNKKTNMYLRVGIVKSFEEYMNMLP